MAEITTVVPALCATHQIELPPEQLPSENLDLEEYVQVCSTYERWFNRAVPQVNQAIVCINDWSKYVWEVKVDIDESYSQISTWKTETHNWRDEVMNAQADLPDGVVIDAYIEANIRADGAYSQHQILSETRTIAIESMTKDDNDNVIEILYRNGDKAEYTYDPKGNMIQEVYRDSNGDVRMGNTTTYTYDADNNFVSSERS